MMWTRHRRRAKKSRFGALSKALVTNPIGYIRADHQRQRDLCRAVEELADAETLNEREAEAIALFIAEEIALHVRDEEEGLFPLLRLRAEPADDIERILGLLSGEHVVDESEAAKIVEGLHRAKANQARTLDRGFKNTLRAFAVCQSRHLALGNAVLLPIASRRLTKEDLIALAQGMTTRRSRGARGRNRGTRGFD